MQITKENIGDVLCLYQTGTCIRIEDVTDRYIYYQQEYGSHYATHEFVADALRITDGARIAAFDRNYELGHALESAELAALKTILDGLHTPEEVQNADVTLNSIRAQQKYLHERLDRELSERTPGPELARAFAAQLYELGNGSHDTLFGHKVENCSGWTGSLSVDGKRFSYDDAVAYMSTVKHLKVPRKQRLDELISSAHQRINTNPFTIHPSPVSEHVRR